MERCSEGEVNMDFWERDLRERNLRERDWSERDWREGLDALSAAHAFEDSVLSAPASNGLIGTEPALFEERAAWALEKPRDDAQGTSQMRAATGSSAWTPEWPCANEHALQSGSTHEGARALLQQDLRDISDQTPDEMSHDLAATDGCDHHGQVEVHLAIYEHRFGLDVSVHATAERALAALNDTATAQCARDPAIRAAVCERFGRWPACGFSEDELEELLEAWSELSDGERLWTTECVVQGLKARCLHTPRGLLGGLDNANRPASRASDGIGSSESDLAWRATGESVDTDACHRSHSDGDQEGGAPTRDMSVANGLADSADAPPSFVRRTESVSSPDAGLRAVPVVAPSDHTMPYDLLDVVHDFERRVSGR
jgi:hypothetical protein